MTKKIKPQKQAVKSDMPAVPLGPLLSRRGKLTIAAGIAVVIAGFYLLRFTDPAGQNWASNLCPFVILGGYALIGIGIVLPDPEKISTDSAQAPSIPHPE